jgi:TonB family protein
MRILTTALLALTPALLHAQATSPAQPRSQAPVLQAKLSSPAGVNASASAAAGTVSAMRISTVIAPKLIKAVNIESAPDVWSVVRFQQQVTVALTVDAQGVPTNIKVVKSSDETLDHRVLKAVSEFRFAPGTLNNIPTDFPITLNVNVVPPSN